VEHLFFGLKKRLFQLQKQIPTNSSCSGRFVLLYIGLRHDKTITNG